MQTPAERQLIHTLDEKLRSAAGFQRILNIGAAKSTVIEDALKEAGVEFVCDRTDVQDCSVNVPYAGRCFVCPAEDMREIGNGEYDLVFANYVMEHIQDVSKAAGEIARVLKPGGYFVATLANPRAPEFVLSRHTPTEFHQWVKGKGAGKEAYDVHYDYRNIAELKKKFSEKGLELKEALYFPFTYGYMYRFPVLKWFSRVYDVFIGILGIKYFMGQVCITWRKID
ncbi:methyltransferase domain-containing protein [Candidatus Uhrbacteria bacterium]|nr:methyltransferase domain-containing protein [Candidatus Uhrbacteria bacterium]